MPLRLTHATTKTRRQGLLTLLFLPAVELRRPYDLRAYSGDALALLTARQRVYGYRHIERFLAELAWLRADVPLTDALARWTAALWKPGLTESAPPVPVFYIDGHKKPVYADALIPRVA